MNTINKQKAINDTVFALKFDLDSLRRLSKDLVDIENPYSVDAETGELLYYEGADALRKEINDVKEWISKNHSILHKLIKYTGSEIPANEYEKIITE